MKSELELIPGLPGKKMPPEFLEALREEWHQTVLPKLKLLERKLALCQPKLF